MIIKHEIDLLQKWKLLLAHAYQSASQLCLYFVTFSLSGCRSSVSLGIMTCLNSLVIKSSVTIPFSSPFWCLLLSVSPVCTLCCNPDLCLFFADPILPVPLHSQSCSASCLLIHFKPVLIVTFLIEK